MKRLLMSLSLLLGMMGSAWATHWTVDYKPSGGDTQTEGYIYALLQVPSQAGPGWTDYVGSEYEIAAFIDGSVRAVQTTNYANQQNPAFWRFGVVGGQSEASAQKQITFKIYNTTTGAEYSLQQTAVFTGESLGPSDALTFQLTEPTSVNMNDFTLNVGETIDLMTQVTVTPQGAAVPENWTWMSQSNSYSIDGNVLTAVQPEKNGVYLSWSAGVSVSNGRVKVTILSPATGLDLQQGQNETTVNVGEGETLKAFLAGCYTITPATSTDQVRWTSADNTIISVDEQMPDDFNIKKPGDVVLTGRVVDEKGNDRAGVSTIQVTVHVKQPVKSITTDFVGDLGPSPIFLECAVGDDLTSYFVDGTAFTINPDDASDKTVSFAVANSGNSIGSVANVLTYANGTITAAAVGEATVTVTSNSNLQASAVVYVRVHNNFTDVTFPQATLPVMYAGQNTDISKDVIGNIQFTPNDATDFFQNGNEPLVSVTSSDNEKVEVSNVAYSMSALSLTATAKAQGTATITVTFYKKNYLEASFDQSQDYITLVQKSFIVSVSPSLTGIDVTKPTYVVNQPSVISVTPEPANATLDPSLLTLSEAKVYVDQQGTEYPNGWNTMDITGPVYNDQTGSYDFTITPLLPGTISLEVTYDPNGLNLSKMVEQIGEVGAPMEIKTNWQWKTIYFANPVAIKGDADFDLAKLFPNNEVSEIRTETEEMLNDATYGYFGDLNLLASDLCFKIKASAPVNYVFSYGQLSSFKNSVVAPTLHYGWNWIPNPYFFNRLLTSALSKFKPSDGDYIVSKEDGFAVYENGQWATGLSALKRGQGYLYFSNSVEDKTLIFADEAQMDGADETPSNARLANNALSRFTFDASRFANNMCIVAQVEGVQSPENYAVVAYVDNECRGLGQCVEGKMFITVHANNGETISFRLFNLFTGELYDIDQTVKFGSRLGSLKSPFQMTSKAFITGINDLRQPESIDAQYYDLGGRAVKGSMKGIRIQRANDGSVRKVMK